MKKLKYFFLMLSMLLFSINVDAACSYEQQAKLNSEAATIKAIYEEQITQLDKTKYTCADGQDDCDLSYSYFKISILNVSENFYVVVKGDNGFNKTFTSKNAVNGIISFDIEDIMTVHTFTFNVYNSDKTDCKGTLNRTFYLTTPRYNVYSSYGYCKDNPEFYMCNKYVSYTDTGFEDFVNKIEDYKEEQIKEEEGKNKTFFQKLWEFVKKNKAVFIAGTCVIVVGVTGYIIIIKKRRKDII